MDNEHYLQKLLELTEASLQEQEQQTAVLAAIGWALVTLTTAYIHATPLPTGEASRLSEVCNQINKLIGAQIGAPPMDGGKETDVGRDGRTQPDRDNAGAEPTVEQPD